MCLGPLVQISSMSFRFLLGWWFGFMDWVDGYG